MLFRRNGPPGRRALWCITNGSAGKSPALGGRRAQWVVALGAHEGMIEGGVWRRVQQQKLAKQPRNRLPQNRYALFSGLLRCGVCGAPMEAKKRAHGRGFDYVCRRKRRQGTQACQGPNLAGETADNSIEQAVWRAISPYLQQAQRDNDAAKAAGLPEYRTGHPAAFGIAGRGADFAAGAAGP